MSAGTAGQRRRSPEAHARLLAQHRWRSMIQRCTNQSHQAYAGYGGRGITVCPEWLASFDAYYAHVGDKPDGMTLDRTNNDLGYFPGNVRWATPKEQAANRRWHPNSIKTHCPQGHPFDDANTYVDPLGRRGCRACRRVADDRCRARRRNEVALL